ncbi:tetratricopeptide repeat protein [Tamlana sp. 2_MG-2023]|uniref:tetratricopeptide repeat protein n=1 Tax=unclassified Tamlana TaxID=2614803 RepID=UPI0026E489EC|nr:MULTISPECIES: tetratricopeptide repeat protein [unclassified Tamlana]MDO6761398.1 tetratricopeptide repeat protein [Tamlana sp. 2_MG-2023]MDO6791988.1 tetratricopeptide repeat protein [Tamlana sp. 1_MG-2023]
MSRFKFFGCFVILFVVCFSCKEDKYKDKLDETQLVHSQEASYIGSKTCVECHNAAFKKWQGSHHDLAMQVANDSTVLGDFNDRKVNIDGVSYHFFKRENKFLVHVTEIDKSEKEYEITYTFGFTPLQQYLVDFDKGRKQVLRVTWDSAENKWFHQYSGDTIVPNDWLHWTQGAQNWNTMCAECHSTNLQKNYDADTDAFHTTYDEINVTCESCHGPGSNHVKWASNEDGSYPDQIIKGQTQEEQLMLCAPCHARRAKLTPDLVPGLSFEDQYLLQKLSTNFYHGDGQIEDEDYVYASFLQSKMYMNGVKCTDCHDPHSMELKFDGNQLCLQCHVPAKYDTEKHHYHKKGTESAQCINCHMTGKVYMGNDFRRDHSFRVPRPDQSVEHGTPNACTGCHTDQTDSWAAEQIVAWYGEERLDHFSDALLLSTESEMSASENAKLEAFINDLTYPEIARATVIDNLSLLSQSQYNAFYTALDDKFPLVRYSALQKFRPLSPEIRIEIATKMLHDSSKLVRIGVAQLLNDIDDQSLAQIDQTGLNKAKEEYKIMLSSSADFSNGRMQLGDYYMQKNDYSNAIEHYNMALKKDSLFTPVYSNLATAYSLVKDYDKALNTLETWSEIEPKVGRVHYLKALLFFEISKNEEAVSELKTAIKLDPKDARSMYNLSTYYYQDDKDLASARQYINAALKVEPGNPNYEYLLALIYQKTGEADKAQRILSKLQANQ